MLGVVRVVLKVLLCSRCIGCRLSVKKVIVFFV